jgi:hypothetical protein
MQSPQPFNQLQLQQQLMLQAQQNLASPSANDLESRRLRMLQNNRNMGLSKDGQLNSVSDIVPNVGSPVQVGLPRADTEMLMKVLFCSCTSELTKFIIFSSFQRFYGL